MKIEVKNVTKKFKNITILENVELEFVSGKIYALVGRNGSGKSVFLKMICGFYSPTSGEILQDGINYIKEKKFPIKTRCLIEKPQFLPELTGFQNLKLLASIQNIITDEEIFETLKLVNLYDDKDKRYFQYSLGMKQKLGIAQVLMEKPEVIILDEPFNGIEKKTAGEIRTLLQKLAESGKLIIIATHIEDDVKTLANVIYEFDDCRVEKINITLSI